MHGERKAIPVPDAQVSLFRASEPIAPANPEPAAAGSGYQIAARRRRCCAEVASPEVWRPRHVPAPFAPQQGRTSGLGRSCAGVVLGVSYFCTGGYSPLRGGMMPLTDVKIKAAKPTAKAYRISDAHSMYLWVTPSGGKLWRCA